MLAIDDVDDDDAFLHNRFKKMKKKIFLACLLLSEDC